MVVASSAGFEAGDFAQISVNGILINGTDRNENNNYRGLHMVLLNHQTGKIKTNAIFDTYNTSHGIDFFIENCSELIPEGTIIVAACKDEMTLALSDMAKKWFKDLGSVEIEKLEYRCGFAFIGIWGKKLPNESRAENKFDQV